MKKATECLEKDGRKDQKKCLEKDESKMTNDEKKTKE